ncbi:sulfatase [Planctomycetota bacterium]|nr:sulfatase [Planctomycetota bacterium]
MSDSQQRQTAPTRPRSGGIWTILALVLVGGIFLMKYVEAPGNNSEGSGTSEESTSTPRHLVVISIDTLRADYLGCYGKAEANTPNMDALAKDGVVFEQHFSSYPLTLPAHLTQLTGVSSLGHRVRDNLFHRLPQGLTTLPESLKEHGFRTGAFVSAHTMKSGSGLERGFDIYDDEGVRKLEPGKLTVSERKADATLKTAADWIASTGGDRAFAYIHLFDPHAPYQPQSVAGTTMQNSDAERYAGEISYVDQQIGVFLDRLRKIEMLEDTLVVITSDHGEGLGQHDELTHGYYCYDTTTHVPLIIRGGGDIKAGTRVPSIVRNYDLAPTLIDLMGVKAEAIKTQTHGVSLLPLINEPDKDIGLNAYVESHYAHLNANWAKIRGLRTKAGLALFSGSEAVFLTGQEQSQRSTDAPEIAAASTEIKRLLSSWIPPANSKSDLREGVAGSPYPGESPVAQDFKPENILDTKDLPSPHSKAAVLKAYQQAELAYDAGQFNVCAANLRTLLNSDDNFLMGHKLLAAVTQALAGIERDTATAKSLVREAANSLERANEILIAAKQPEAALPVRVNMALLYVWLGDDAKLKAIAIESEPQVYWMFLVSEYRAGAESATQSAEDFLDRGGLKGGALAQAQAHLELMKDGETLKMAPWEQ